MKKRILIIILGILLLGGTIAFSAVCGCGCEIEGCLCQETSTKI